MTAPMHSIKKLIGDHIPIKILTRENARQLIFRFDNQLGASVLVMSETDLELAEIEFYGVEALDFRVVFGRVLTPSVIQPTIEELSSLLRQIQTFKM